MGWVRRLLGTEKAGKKEDACRAPSDASSGAVAGPSDIYAPGTRIVYDPELIAQYKEDHRRLLGLFSAIDEAFWYGELEATTEMLKRFLVGFQEHVLSEKIRLYIYLEHKLVHNPRGFEVVQGFRHEMDGIAKAVIEFMVRYEEIYLQSHAQLRASFADELAHIGQLLAKRIRCEEEDLYRLYVPADGVMPAISFDTVARS